MIRVALSGFLLAVLLGACSDGIAESDLIGYWRLDTIEVDGVVTAIERGVNTAGPAWIHFDEGYLEGDAGCNDFRSTDAAPWALHESRLVPGEVIFTAVLCSIDGDADAAMFTEWAIQRFIWGAARDGFEVAITTDGVMAWSLGATRLLFSPADGPVYPPPPLPATGIGQLDCSPGIMIREQVADTGIDGEAILRVAVPEVVTVFSTREGWFWWGRDATGSVVAGVAKGDIVPVIYELFTCKDR